MLQNHKKNLKLHYRSFYLLLVNKIFMKLFLISITANKNYLSDKPLYFANIFATVCGGQKSTTPFPVNL